MNKQQVKDYLRKTYPDRVLKWVEDAKWSGPKEIPLSEIKMDRRPGGREMDKVKGIAKAFENGDAMEAVILVKNDGKYKVADGYHRTLGARHAGKTTIKAMVGEVQDLNGPWDKDMHDAKLNVGKAAFESNDFFSKVAEETVIKPLDQAEVDKEKTEAEASVMGGTPAVTSLEGYDNLEKGASFGEMASYLFEKAKQLRGKY